MARWRVVAALLIGLLLACGLTACNDAPANHPQSQHPGSGNVSTVNVTITDSAIQTNDIRFSAAQPTVASASGPGHLSATYRFVVVNKGIKPCEFMIATPLKDAQGQSVQMDRSIALVDNQYSPRGATRTFDLTFSQPSNTPLEFASHEGNDYQNGLRVGITVT